VFVIRQTSVVSETFLLLRQA